MILSLKKIFIASIFIQQSLGFWLVKVDKKPSSYYGQYHTSIKNGYNLPPLYNYEKKDKPWVSSCGCTFPRSSPMLNTLFSQCHAGCDDIDPDAKYLYRTVDEKTDLISRIEIDTDGFKPCGMVYDNYNFTTYVCGDEVNDRYAKLSLKSYDQIQDANNHYTDIWIVTVDDQASKYGYKNQLVIDYMFLNSTYDGGSNSKCITSIDLPNDKLFDQPQEKDGITCDNKLYDPVTAKGVGNVLSSLENVSTKESYPCFFVEHKLRFSIYACGKQVPVLSDVSATTTTIPVASATSSSSSSSSSSTTTKSSSSLKPTSSVVPSCKTGYCGKKSGNGPTGACCSSSDDCLDTCNSNGKCGVSDETGEPKNATCPT
ncbi:unnamed protein product [Cunninghamella blakesleeana]